MRGRYAEFVNALARDTVVVQELSLRKGQGPVEKPPASVSAVPKLQHALKAKDLELNLDEPSSGTPKQPKPRKVTSAELNFELHLSHPRALIQHGQNMPPPRACACTCACACVGVAVVPNGPECALARAHGPLDGTTSDRGQNLT